MENKSHRPRLNLGFLLFPSPPLLSLSLSTLFSSLVLFLFVLHGILLRFDAFTGRQSSDAARARNPDTDGELFRRIFVRYGIYIGRSECRARRRIPSAIKHALASRQLL